MKDTAIYIRVTGTDYARLLDALDALDYHWLSGQRAAEAPAFLRQLDENVMGVRVIKPSERMIGYYPVEVLSEAERAQTFLRCRSVEQVIAMLEKIHHVTLTARTIPKRVGNRESAAYRNFVTTLQALIFKEFHIDIVQLVNTEDENLLYVKLRAGESNVICKNMPQLYQQYLNNTMTMEQFAHSVGVHYQYALRDAQAASTLTNEQTPDRGDEGLEL